MPDYCTHILLIIFIICLYFFLTIENFGLTPYKIVKKNFNDVGKIISDADVKKFPESIGEFRNRGNGSWTSMTNKPYACSFNNPKWNTLAEGAERCRKDNLCKGFQMYSNGSGHCLFKDISEVNKEKTNLVRFARHVPKIKPIKKFVNFGLGTWQTGNGASIPYACADQIPTWESPDEAAARCLADESCDGFDMRPNGRGGCLYKNTLNAKVIPSENTRYARVSEAELCKSKGKYWVFGGDGKYSCEELKVI